MKNIFMHCHYKAIAAMLAEYGDDATKQDIVEGFVIEFENENSAFLPDKFRKACGRDG